MNTENILEYLKTWIKVNAQELHGYPRMYVSIHDLDQQLNALIRITQDES